MDTVYEFFCFVMIQCLVILSISLEDPFMSASVPLKQQTNIIGEQNRNLWAIKQ